MKSHSCIIVCWLHNMWKLSWFFFFFYSEWCTCIYCTSSIRAVLNQRSAFRDTHGCLCVSVIIRTKKLNTYMNCGSKRIFSNLLQSSSASPCLTRGRCSSSPLLSYSSTVSSGSQAWTETNLRSSFIHVDNYLLLSKCDKYICISSYLIQII